MKKKLSIILMIATLAVSSFALVACGHTHEYKEVVKPDGSNLATEATCTTPATYYKVCECGEKHATETFSHGDPIAHNYVTEVAENNANLVTPATCQNVAVYKKYCSACGALHATETFNGTALDENNHTGFTDEVKKPEAIKEGANHFHGIIYYKSCGCGAISTDETEVFEDESTIIAHTFDQEVVDAEYATGVAADHFHGTEYFKSCSCGTASDTEKFYDTDIIAHTFDQEVKNTDTLKEEANHAHGTIYFKSCSCGTVSTNPADVFEDTNKVVYELGAIKTYLDDANANVVFDLSELATTYEVTLDNLTVTYGGVAITNFTLEDGVLTIAESEFKADNGKQLSGVTEIVITVNGIDGESAVVATFNATATLTIVTNLITTADEFLNMKNDMIADYQGIGTTSGVDLKRYGGYFELGNNIDLNGANYEGFHNWYNGVSTVVGGVSGWDKTGGFQGVFDGCGYTVSNFAISGSTGMFGGVIGQNGVVKNVGFTNVSFNAGSNTSGLTQNLFGKVENIYFQVNQLKGGAAPNGTGVIAFGIQSPATVKNVFVEVDSLGYTPGNLGYKDPANSTTSHDNWTNVIGRAYAGASVNSFENIIAITAGEAVLNDHNVENSLNGIGVGDINLNAERAIAGFDTRADLIQNLNLVSSVFSTLDPTYWTTVDGMLVWKSLQFPQTTTLGVNRVAVGGSADLAILNAGIANAGVTWTSANAGVSFNGATVSVDSSVEPGTTISVVATNRYGATKSFELTTYPAIIETLATKNISLNDGATETSLAITAQGEIQSVLFDGVEISSYTYTAGESIVLPKSVYENTLKQTNLVVKTKDGETEYQTTIPLNIATMVIASKEDLASFATLTRGNTWGVGELYVLASDIDYEGGAYNINLNVTGANNTTGTGFAGTFDGRGHIIKNIVVGANGFISGIRQDGILKNVTFLNATQNGTGFFVQASSWSKELGGTIENVYLQVKTTVSKSSAFAGGNYGTARIRNVVVDVVSKVDSYAFWDICFHTNWGSHSSVYGIGVDRYKHGVNGEYSNNLDVSQIFADFEEFKAGGKDTNGVAINYNVMDNDFWNIVEGAPVPARLTTETLAITNTEVTDIPVESTVTITNTPVAYAKYELVSEVAGVSINGNVVSISAQAQGETFTVKVTNQVTGESATKDFTVQSLDATVFDSLDVDLGTYGAEDNIVLDLTETLNKKGLTDSDVTAVTVDGYDASAKFADGAITYTKAELNTEATLGEHTFIVKAEKEGVAYIIKQPVVVCSKIISTKADADAMLSYAIFTSDNTARKSVTGYFILGDDIDMAGGQFGISYYGTDADQSITENGAVNPVYRATFDGRNYTVSNPTFSKNASGVFGFGYDCTIKNLKMVGVTVSHSGASALIEGAGGTTVISNVFVQGALKGGTPADWGEQSLALGKVDGALHLTMTDVYTVVTETTSTDATYMGTHFGENKRLGLFKNCVGLNLTALNVRMSLAGATFANSQVVTTKEAGYAIAGSGSAWEAFHAYCAPAVTE